jgi:hypothetical protein
MSELLQDSVYRRYLEAKPDMPKHLADPRWVKTAPWVVYIQKEVNGPWGKRSFWKYRKAYKFMMAWMKKGCHDAAINNVRVGFEPPMRLARVKGKYVVGSDGVRRQATVRIAWKLPVAMMVDQPEHHWCKYCRRPTIFKFYSKHKRLGAVDPSVPRCCICGASARIALSHSDKRFRVH